MRYFPRFAVLFCIVLTLAACAGAAGEEWPKWLGPRGDGICTDPIAEKWPDGGPKRLWSYKSGLGFTSIVGVNGKVYAFGMQGNKDVLTALDAGTGSVVWAQSYVVTHKADAPQAKNDANDLPVPEATPIIDGDRIYTYGGGSDLVCRNLADGKVAWEFNVLDQTHASILPWNAASTPLVTDRFICVQGGKGSALAVAIDKQNGQLIWKAENAMGGYAAPILISVEDKPQIVVFGGQLLFGLDPADGKTLWKIPWQTSYDVNAATPVYKDGHLFITTGYGHGCAMIEVHAASARILWAGKEISSKYQPCILDKGTLFGNSGGRLKCLKWPTKDVLWSSNNLELGEGGSFVIDGSQLVSISDRGKVSLVHFGAAGANVVSEMQLFDYDKVWSAPVIYQSKLFVKGKEELVCLDISGK